MARQIFKMFSKKLSKKEAIEIIKKKYLEIKKLKEDINTMAKKYELKNGKLVEQTNDEQIQNSEIPDMEETTFNEKILNNDERVKLEQEILNKKKLVEQQMQQQQMQQHQQMQQQEQIQQQEQYNILIVMDNAEPVNVITPNINQTMILIKNSIDEQQSITVGERIVNGRYIIEVIPTKL